MLTYCRIIRSYHRRGLATWINEFIESSSQRYYAILVEDDVCSFFVFTDRWCGPPVFQLLSLHSIWKDILRIFFFGGITSSQIEDSSLATFLHSPYSLVYIIHFSFTYFRIVWCCSVKFTTGAR